MIAEYLLALEEGLGRNKALDRGRALYSVGRQTLRDWLKASDLPEAVRTGPNPAYAGTKAASEARHTYALEDLRRLEFRLARVTEQAIDGLVERVAANDGVLDAETEHSLNRLTTVLRRVAAMDADLDRRGGSSNPNPEPESEEEQDVLAAAVERAENEWKIIEGGKTA